MKKIFSIGSVSYKLLYPLFLTFCCFGSYITKTFLIPHTERTSFNSILTFIVHTFSLLPFGIITLILNKYYSKTGRIKETQFNKKKLSLLLLIISVVEILQYVSFHYSNPFENEKQNTYQFVSLFKVLQLIFTMIICIFLFKNQLYRHHYISGGFALFFVTILTIIECLYNTIGYNVRIILLYFLGYIFNCIQEIIEKWIMQFLLVKPFTLLFYEGLFLFGFFIVFLIVILSCSFQVFNFSFLWNNIGWCFLLMFFDMALMFTKIQTLFYYSPTHRFAADIIVIFYLYIFALSIGGSSSIVSSILVGVLLILIIISVVIFNEIIIVHVLNMDENTTSAIVERSDNEHNQMLLPRDKAQVK